MGLLSFLKRSPDASPKALPAVDAADSVQQARTRARQRLIGAVVLVIAGVAGFSLLFESQPRPVRIDTPIEIARPEGSAPAPAARRGATPPVVVRAEPAVVPGLEPRSEPITETAADAGREVPAPASAPEAVRPAASKPAAPPKPDKPADTRPTDAARAQALLDGRASTAAPTATSTERFVVQVGAFADASAARESRLKVEKLGLKTYTQVAEPTPGKRVIRVRVGPFASRAEADRAAGKIKSAGLPTAVLTL